MRRRCGKWAALRDAGSVARRIEAASLLRRFAVSPLAARCAPKPNASAPTSPKSRRQSKSRAACASKHLSFPDRSGHWRSPPAHVMFSSDE
ncbi:hypothetical protein A8H31_05145 [Burkholderia thailandensis]|nr:hypothetical protein A8H31_05145 [Burkholderia thailandensis]PHH34769.1 hypothetical protein CRX59_30100 [Burkholderia thailandensis]